MISYVNSKPLIQGFTFTNIRVLYKASLGTRDLKPYPHNMPFLVYGTKQQQHITHIFTASPNAHLSADQIKILDYIPAGQIKNSDYIPQGEGPIYAHLNYNEMASQPFASMFAVDPANFFRSDAMLTSAKFSHDIDGKIELGVGRITLTKNVYADTHWLNLDPIPPGWRAPVTQGADCSLLTINANKLITIVDNDWNDIIVCVQAVLSQL
jgi:hypothetical protein